VDFTNDPLLCSKPWSEIGHYFEHYLHEKGACKLTILIHGEYVVSSCRVHLYW